jgi:hypothetical protein
MRSAYPHYHQVIYKRLWETRYGWAADLVESGHFRPDSRCTPTPATCGCGLNRASPVSLGARNLNTHDNTSVFPFPAGSLTAAVSGGRVAHLFSAHSPARRGEQGLTPGRFDRVVAGGSGFGPRRAQDTSDYDALTLPTGAAHLGSGSQQSQHGRGLVQRFLILLIHTGIDDQTAPGPESGTAIVVH